MEKTLKQIKEEQNEILSGWNGEDTTFYVNGESYNEDDVNRAEEILEKVGELEELLNENE
jgi:uncharacterized pyridoxamine 5'-phosphate oxidase family protein